MNPNSAHFLDAQASLQHGRHEGGHGCDMEMEVDKVADMVADMEVDTILTNFHHYDNIRLERPKGVKDKVKHARSGLKVGVQRVPRLLF